MQPEQFLDVAERLATAGGPGDCRSVISRAYYAVFNVAERFLGRMNFHRPRKDYHPTLRRRLMASGDADVSVQIWAIFMRNACRRITTWKAAAPQNPRMPILRPGIWSRGCPEAFQNADGGLAFLLAVHRWVYRVARDVDWEAIQRSARRNVKRLALQSAESNIGDEILRDWNSSEQLAFG